MDTWNLYTTISPPGTLSATQCGIAYVATQARSREWTCGAEPRRGRKPHGMPPRRHVHRSPHTAHRRAANSGHNRRLGRAAAPGATRQAVAPTRPGESAARVVHACEPRHACDRELDGHEPMTVRRRPP